MDDDVQSRWESCCIDGDKLSEGKNVWEDMGEMMDKFMKHFNKLPKDEKQKVAMFIFGIEEKEDDEP